MKVEVISNENDAGHCYRKEILEIKKRLPKILEDPMVKEFLKDKENQTAFNRAMEILDEVNIKNLDQKFRNFHRINRIIRYMTGLIKRYPIDYDKRVKLRSSRYQLVVDKSINNGRDGSNVTMKDLLVEGKGETPVECLMHKEDKQKNFFQMENQYLNEAIEKLDPKQHQILYMYYEQGLNNKEIGEYFGQTEQNISYWHKKSIRQLEELIK
ncbi:sigma-70 family RNA polymerase sigma factor [Peribacillus frigoritolerans]|uniref:sigma-70 family RNA polymerase sigma factor n=1 Tax=Peribacillus frigoritolerans TaxID=450367 RepID=UPI001DFA76F5|nr:sigma-70 family RNA polymerase sigma factor [Listeria monocytogenes]